jgi:type II secretory pathway component PulF
MTFRGSLVDGLRFVAINAREIAGLCRRLATALESGIDVRRVFAREAERARRPRLRRQLQTVCDGINGGSTLEDALRETDEDFFPDLFHQLSGVGEKTGHLAEVFVQLAEHYENQVRLRRLFLTSISWPLAQLAIAIALIGFLIYIMGVIGRPGAQMDPLGFGLVGPRGLAAYVTFLVLVGAAIALVIYGMRNGVLWLRPVQHLLLAAPGLGPALQTLALSRMAWLMHLTMGAGMNLRQALQLSIRGARYSRYVDRVGDIDRAIVSGQSIHEALAHTHAFPPEFLDSVQVGEDSGRLVESMAVLARQYHERANAAVYVLTALAGYAVWATIAAVIIFLIFRLFSFYVNSIYDAMP